MIFRAAGIRETVKDGLGMALEIFFQGCNKRCPKCHNPELQDFDGGSEMDTKDIIAKMYFSVYESLVLCGGEPLDQPYATLELLETMEQFEVPTILYTGYEWEEIDDKTKELATVIICGPYEAKRKRAGTFTASYNQKIYLKGEEIENTTDLFKRVRQAL